MIRVLNILVGAVLGFTAALGMSGRAVELFSEAGQCRFGLERDGTFYQSEFHTENFMNPSCISLGVSDKWRGFKKLGWRASFIATNSIQARSNIAVNDETRGLSVPCNLPSCEAGCMIEFSGSGKTYGISLGLTAEQPLATHLSVIGETGLFFFQHHFKSEAQFIDCCGRTISYNETSKLWDMPSPFLGLTLRYRNVYVAARHFWPTGHRALSLTNHEMNQIVVGVVKTL